MADFPHRLLVLSSQSRHLLTTFSLTTPAPQPTAGEAAIRDLLRLVRSPRPQSELRNQKFKNTPGFQNTFLSGGLPRDRRGRVAHKVMSIAGDEDIYGEDTPRLGPVGYVVDIEREREREFLEALRLVVLSILKFKN